MSMYFRNGFLVFMMSLLLACSADLSGDKEIEKARGYLAEGKSNAAMIELKNALQKNGNNQEARWLLGAEYFNKGLYADAVKELSKARELGRSDEDVLPLLSQSLLNVGDKDTLQRLSIDNLSDSARSYVLASQGMSKLRSGEGIEKSSVLINQAVEASATAFALEVKARLMGASSRGDWGAVRQQLQKVFEVDPVYAPAWSLQGDIEFQSLNLMLAEQAYTKAINSSNLRLEDYYKRALVRLQMEDIEGATKDIDLLVKRAPKSPSTHYVQGIIHMRNGKIKDAITAFDIAQNNEDRFPMSLFYLATAHNMEGNFSQAEDFAYRFLAIDPDNQAGRKLLATMKLQQGEYVETETLITPVFEQNGEDIIALNLLASALLKQGKTKEGVEMLAKVALLQPESAEAMTKLGASLLASGDTSGGLEHIEAALKLDPSYEQAGLVLVSALIRKKDFDGALKVVDEFEQKNPDIAAHHVLRGQVYMAAERLDDAKSEYKKALDITPGDPVVSQNLALLAMQDKKFELARNYYLKVLEHHPNYLPVMLKLAAVAEIQRDTEEMVKYFKLAKSAHPKEVQPRVLLARYYLTQGKPEQVPILIGELDSSLKNQPEVLNVVGLSHLQKKEFLDAKVIFQKVASQRRDAPQPHHNIGLSYLGLGKKSKAEEEFKKALEVSPSYFQPRIELVRLLLLRKERDSALENLAILKKLAPEHPEVLQLDAARARLDGNQKEALNLSALAFEKLPTTRNMLVLVQQNWAVGQKQEAQNLLESWLKDHPKDVLARLELADMYLGKGEEEKAGDEYTQILAIQKDNTLALNNLAWLLRDKNPKQALEYAQKASDQSQQSPLAMDTLAVVLLKNNEAVKAQRTIERALEKFPNNPSIKYHSAMINAAAGDKAKAKKYLTELLSGKAIFPEREEAEALLKTL